MTSSTGTPTRQIPAIPPPSRDRFYDPTPGRIAPGRIIRVREVRVPTRTPANGWQVVHGTVATGGHPIAVSGTVLVPDAVWAGHTPRPVLSYGTGVHGLGRDGAPSYLLRSGTEPELPLIDGALRRGWAVAITDGHGLGMPGPHTYGAGDSGGHAMLDSARAATTVVPGLQPGGPVMLWGYSEGGRYAARAAEIQSAYAPELNLVAVAAGGVPADLAALAAGLDRGPYRGLALAVLVGLAHAYRDPQLWAILNDRGIAAAARAADLDATGLLRDPPPPLTDLATRPEPWNDPAWAATLRQENLGHGAPSAPILLYHASNDEITPIAGGLELFAAYRRLGAAATWRQIAAPNHAAGAYHAAHQVIGWLASHLATARPAPACDPAGAAA